MAETAESHIGSVLLIEDNEDIINGIQTSLTNAKYKVNVATTARQAFSQIFKSPADIIILDINLQDLDGFHFAKELKRSRQVVTAMSACPACSRLSTVARPRIAVS